LNQFSCLQEKRVCHGNAKSACGLEIDDEIELGRLQNRQVGRFFALENSANVDAQLMLGVTEATSIAYQASINGVLPGGEYRRHRVAREYGAEPFAVAAEQGVGNDEQRVDLLIRKTGDGWLEIAFGAGSDNFEWHADGVGELLPEALVEPMTWILWVDHHCEGSCLRHKLMEHLQLLCEQLAGE